MSCFSFKNIQSKNFFTPTNLLTKRHVLFLWYSLKIYFFKYSELFWDKTIRIDNFIDEHGHLIIYRKSIQKLFLKTLKNIVKAYLTTTRTIKSKIKVFVYFSVFSATCLRQSHWDILERTKNKSLQVSFWRKLKNTTFKVMWMYIRTKKGL